MADSKVGILIEAKNNASSTIRTVKTELGDLGKSASGVDSLSSSFSALGKAVSFAGLAFGAVQIGKQAVELAQYSAQVQRAESSFATFSQQAGLASNTLDQLRSASRGTISDFDLLQSSNRALALGVADSSQELTQLLEVAIARGKALGVSANDAFSDLVTGIGRMSPLILDNLGIITGGEKLFDSYAASIGKATSALTDQERKQALVNKVISESQGLIEANATAGDDAASSFERASAAFQNIKADLGELFGPAIAVFADKLASAVSDVSNALTKDSGEKLQEVQGQVSKLTELMQAYNDAIVRLQDASITGDGAGMKKAQAEAMGLQMSMEGLALTYNKVAEAAGKPQIDVDALKRGEIAYTDASMAAQQLAASGNAVVASSVNQQAALANLGGSLAVLSGEFQRVIALQSAFAGQQAGLSAIAGQVIGAAGQEEGLKFLRQTTVELENQQKQWQDAGYSVAEVNALSLAYNDSLRKTTEETYGFGSAAVKANKAAAASIKAVNAEYEDLKSKISGVLSGALGDIAGVNVDEILPRTDAVGEDARRLADVAVNGFASPWADYLANKFPDTIGAAFKDGGDIKQTAAQLLRDFQDGLRPELLDKGKAKELVRRAIIGEQNMKALTDEIAKELAAEMGISVAAAQAAATSALGGGGGGVTGGSVTPKQVPIVPTIDTSKLPTTPIDVKGNIFDVEVSESAKGKTIDIRGNVIDIDISESAKNKSIDVLGTLTGVLLSPDTNYPDVLLAATISYIRPLGAFDILEKPIPLSATIARIDPTLTQQKQFEDAKTFIESRMVIVLTPNISTELMDDGQFNSAAALIGSKLSVEVTPNLNYLGISDTTFTDAITFLTENLSAVVTPQITTGGIDTSTALAYMESELAPIVTPYVNYLGIPQEDLTAAGLWIGAGIVTGITQSNIGSAIVTSLNNSQELIKGSGKTSGANWGSGFLETVGQNVPSALVNLLVALVTPGVLNAIQDSGTKTGAQG